MWKSDGRVKGKALECGLVGKSDGWVKGKAAGVWSGGEKRWLGQREKRWSVVWQEKAPPESKGKPCECGLVGKSATWVKGKCAKVWSNRSNRRLSQRGMCWSVVWQEKPPPESKGKPLECGLASQTATQVKGKCGKVWSNRPNRHPGQREMRGSVV